MAGWIDFWNQDNPIYVNDRHKLLHYKLIAGDIAALIGNSEARVLDYGCGEALAADSLVRHCSRLMLSDAAPNVRAKLAERFGSDPAISILAPEDVAALPPVSLDLVIVHSLAQYVERAEFARLIASLAEKLAPGGRLVIGDILPPGLSPLADARALLAFGFEGGFLLPAIAGLARTAFSDYRKIRAELGLQHYAAPDMLAVIEAAGLTARRLDRNLGHNQARMAFVGLKARLG